MSRHVCVAAPASPARARIHVDWRPLKNVVAPEYPDLAAGGGGVPRGDQGPVFITVRFRSGSTLLWNLFRHTPGITAYYEPLHPTLQLPPAQRVPVLDPTHYDVDEYWTEYDRIEGLEHWYTEPWHRHDLYLDALDWQPALHAYIQVLMRSAPVVRSCSSIAWTFGWTGYGTSSPMHGWSISSAIRAINGCRRCGSRLRLARPIPRRNL